MVDDRLTLKEAEPSDALMTRCADISAAANGAAIEQGDYANQTGRNRKLPTLSRSWPFPKSAMDQGMPAGQRHHDASLGHHGDQIPVTKPVSHIPAYAHFNDFPIESATAIDRVSGNGLGHGTLLARSWQSASILNPTR
jgi:hypothetical protein